MYGRKRNNRLVENKWKKEETVRREPISKSCEITQADNLNRRRRLSRKAQCFKIEAGTVIKIFLL